MRFLAIVLGTVVAAQLPAQWLRYPTPGIPRTKDGKPDLAAPAPKTADGKPDFSGMWGGARPGQLADFTIGVEVSMLPAAEELYRARQANLGKDRPSGSCLPHSVTDFDAHGTPRKLIQTSGNIVLLFEAYHSFREIFIDGRPLPATMEPAWFGYSTGKWEGDTLVVTTAGINERTWLDDGGHPHSDALRITERFRRPNFGNIQIEVTIDDPKMYRKPWTAQVPWRYVADTELLDWVCENNKDLEHMPAK
jgi:hypothetical protein